MDCKDTKRVWLKDWNWRHTPGLGMWLWPKTDQTQTRDADACDSDSVLSTWLRSSDSPDPSQSHITFIPNMAIFCLMDTTLANNFQLNRVDSVLTSHFTDLMTGFYCACILCFRISCCQQAAFSSPPSGRLGFDTYSVTAGQCGDNRSPCTLQAAAPGSWWCCPRTEMTWLPARGLWKHCKSHWVSF